MNSRVMQVYYDANLLPFKDKERKVHFPIVGNTFAGNHKTTNIHFYVDQIGGTTGVSWVIVSKLPNGKIGYEPLSAIGYDDEGTPYLDFDMSGYYTSVKGDLYLALRGYQGQITFTDSNDDGIYEINGDPLIEVTGTIKFAINYSPMVNTGTQVLPTDVDRLISALGNYIANGNGIVVLPNTSADISGYENGQLFFVKNANTFYEKYNGELALFTKYATETYVDDKDNATRTYVENHYFKKYKYSDTSFDTSTTISTIFSTIGNEPSLVQIGSGQNWYLMKLSKSGTTYSFEIEQLGNANRYYGGGQASLTFSTITSNYAKPYADYDYISTHTLAKYPYSVANITSSTTLAELYAIVGSSPCLIQVGNGGYWYLTQLTSSFGSKYQFSFRIVNAMNNYTGNLAETTTLSTIFAYGSEYAHPLATQDYVDSAIADFLQNEYSKVNTTTYPTLNSFLASTGEEGYIYLYPIDTSDESKGYYQYIWENNAWVSLGSTNIDLGDYATKSYVDETFATKSELTIGLSGKQDTLTAGSNITIDENNVISATGGASITVDSAFSEVSTNPVENRVISLAVKEINYELAVIRESLFEVLLTELDYKVSYAMSYAIPETLSDTDGTHRVVYSETMLKEVEGNGVVLNQLLKIENETQNFSNGVTVERENGLITLNGTASADLYSGLNPIGLQTVVGHKYFVKAFNTNDAGVYLIGCGTAYFDSIFTCTTADTRVSLLTKNGKTYNNLSAYVQVFDLTLKFGAGNEPLTTDDNRIQWLLSLGYIAYNTGSLENTTISGVRIKDSNGNVISVISIPQTTLLGALNSHDTISVVEGNVVEGEQLYNLVLTRNVGIIDLSTIQWLSNNFSTQYNAWIYTITDKANGRTNLIAQKYSVNDVAYGDMVVGNIRGDTNLSRIWVKTSATSSDGETPSGYVQYELATPTQTTIATDLEFDQVSSLIEQGGSIEPIFTNVPPNLTTTFVVKKAVGE